VTEVVAYSFTSQEAIERLRLGDVPLLRVANPLSEDQSVMRPLLLPGLLDAARHNAAHGRPALALFESAHTYRVSGSLDEVPAGSPHGAAPAHERHHVGMLMTQALPRTWRSPERPADFYAAKSVLEAMLASVRVSATFEQGERPFLHPGRTATVLAGDERKLGWVGELHPAVAAEWDLDGVAAFEIDFDLLAEIAPPPARYRDVTTYPPVVQDIAVVVGEDVPAAEIEAAVSAAAGPLLDRLELFDVYRGDQVGEGNKSLALRLEFRSPERTLTDEDVVEARGAIERALEVLGAKLRA
jgi:phenylalanyl-tRNA synthetase beta chain